MPQRKRSVCRLPKSKHRAAVGRPSRFRRPGGGSDEPQGASHAMRDGCRGCRVLGARSRDTRPLSGAAPTDGRRVDAGAARRGLSAFRSSRGIVLATVLLFALGWLAQPESLSTGALSGMFPFAATLALVALGQTLVIQQGGIDLSVPGVRVAQRRDRSVLFEQRAGDGRVDAGDRNRLRDRRGAAGGPRQRPAGEPRACGAHRRDDRHELRAVRHRRQHLRRHPGAGAGEPLAIRGLQDLRGDDARLYRGRHDTAWSPFWSRRPYSAGRFEAVGANPRAAGPPAWSPAATSWRPTPARRRFSTVLAGIFLAGLMQLPSAFQGDSYLMPSIAAVVLGGNVAVRRDRKPGRDGRRGAVPDAAAATGVDHGLQRRRAVPVPGRRDHRRRRRLQREVRPVEGPASPARPATAAAGYSKWRAFVAGRPATAALTMA